MVIVEPVTRFTFAVSTIVRVFDAPAIGLFCSIVFTLNSGMITVSGSLPAATPCCALPVLVISADTIIPRLFELPSTMAALTVTVGDTCALVGLVSANVTVLEVPWVVPPFAAVSTRVPVDRDHAPAVPKRFDVDEIVKLPSAVWAPVRPVMVTVLPSARL